MQIWDEEEKMIRFIDAELELEDSGSSHFE